jgi:hypothetical protein
MSLFVKARAPRRGRGASFVRRGAAWATAIGIGACACAAGCASSSTGGGGGDAPGGPAPTSAPTSTPTGTSKPPPPPPPAITEASACTAYAKARCAKQKSCAAFQYELAWGDDATCEARTSLGCVERFAEPGVSLKPDGLDACARAIEAVACDDFALGVLPPACTVAGTLAKGAKCAHDEQCASGYCKKGSFGACGSCGDRSTAGGYCSAGTDCAPGLVCASGSCRAPVALGGSCSSSSPCGPGLACIGGRCAKGAPAGTSCGLEPGAPDPCDRTNGVVCSPLVMSCTQVKVVAAGQKCNPYQDVCAGGGECNGYR